MLPSISVGQTNAASGQPSEASGLKQYLKVGKGIVPPKVIFDPKPLDPPSCKITHEAVAILWLGVGERGTVDAVRVERSASHDLDQRAIDAVKQWKFEPATKGGKPVPVHVDVEVSFHLC
jgi:protein TonB